MRTFFLLSLLILSSPPALASEPPPNVVFILADDLGIGDVKCYGGDRCLIETPNIDALAERGLKFTDAHVNASVCMPTRVAIMTGRYPWRFGRTKPGGPWGYVGPAFDSATFTLADMFRTAGYITGYVGKWHLGTEMTTKDGRVQNETNVDFTKPLVTGPVQLGFHESFILPGSLDMFPYAFAHNNSWQGEVTAAKGWSAFNRIGAAEKDFEDHEVLETFYTQAETFIRNQSAVAASPGTPAANVAPRQKPFFLYLALTAPHTPTSPGKKFRGKSQLGVYGDFVMEVDHAVERVVAALRETGQHDNTLILFSSDHGPAPYAGNILKATPGQIHLMEQKGHFPSGIHRGYKFAVYEGALRVPLVAQWPGVVEPGGECRQLVGLCDLMATFAEISGGDIPAGAGGDSVSFAPLLSTPQMAGRRKDLIMQSVGPFVVRDGQWKLCLCPGSGATEVHGNKPTPTEAWTAVLEGQEGNLTWEELTAAPFVQLFDLQADPHEDHNIADMHPVRVKQMVSLLKSQISRGRSTPGPALSNDVPGVNVIRRIPNFVRERIK